MEKDITIAGNTFSVSDIEHLVSTAQEPPSEFEKEVHEELERLEKLKEKKTS